MGDIDFTEIDRAYAVTRVVDTDDGPVFVSGMSVRTLVRALQSIEDPDALVCYMATVDGTVMVGPVAVVGSGGGDGVVYLLGPEAVPEIEAMVKKTNPER